MAGEATEAEAPVEPDSSPMVETPVEGEEPIAEVEAPVEAEPAKPKRRSRAKKAVETAEIAVVEPVPPEAPPAETATDAEPAKPVPSKAEGPKRRSRAKKLVPSDVDGTAPEAEAAAVEVPADAPVPEADNDAAEGSPDDSDEPRRGGWWQRTFG